MREQSGSSPYRLLIDFDRLAGIEGIYPFGCSAVTLAATRLSKVNEAIGKRSRLCTFQGRSRL